MVVFQMLPAPDHRWVFAKDAEARRFLRGGGNGQPPEIDVEWDSLQLDLPIADLAEFSPKWLCLSSRAQGVLRQFLTGCFRLTLNGLDGLYEAFLVTRVIDGMDLQKSHIIQTSQGSITLIRHAIFHRTQVEGVHLFRIPQNQMNFFVSEQFRDKVIEAGLVGFSFSPCELI